MFFTVLCAIIVHSGMHTHMNIYNSLLDFHRMDGPISLCLGSFYVYIIFILMSLLHVVLL